VAAYEKDRRVHDRISARLAHFIDSNGPRVLAAAPDWRVPTLLMYAGDDHLVKPEGSRAFAAAAPRNKVHAQAFEGLYHEIFNEADPSAVFGTLKAWLDVLAPNPNAT
jgi:alpha-beta hydrolase superfamily lysophospholipase